MQTELHHWHCLAWVLLVQHLHDDREARQVAGYTSVLGAEPQCMGQCILALMSWSVLGSTRAHVGHAQMLRVSLQLSRLL